MKNIYQYILIEIFNIKKDKLPTSAFNKKIFNAEIEFKHLIHDIFFILLAVVSASFGLKGFLLPNMFIDGGVMGISLIIAEISKIPLSILIVAVNIPFIIMGISAISKQFAIKSVIAITLLAFSVHFVQFPVVTEDKLLIAVFGGFFLGLGIGLAVRGGSVIDGTEVLAVFVSRKTSLTIGDIVMLFNVVIFGVAAYVFNIEIALYAMLTYLVASKTIDFVVSGIEEYVGVTIISPKSNEIRIAIIEELGRSCTIYKGKGGQALNDIDIIYILVTRLELTKLETEIEKIDQNAFITMHSVKDAKGGMIKKRPL